MTGPRWAGKWRWIVWPALSFPLAVLSHEAGHYAAYIAFGFADPALHYGSASFAAGDAFWEQMRAGSTAAAAQIAPLWEVGVASGLGLLASLLTVTACVLIARRRPHPFVVGLGLIAALRYVGSAVVLLMVLFGRRASNGSDEEHVAMTLHVPELALQLLGVVVLIASWAMLLRVLAREGRAATGALFAGIVLGGAIYLGVLGPWLLP